MFKDVPSLARSRWARRLALAVILAPLLALAGYAALTHLAVRRFEAEVCGQYLYLAEDRDLLARGYPAEFLAAKAEQMGDPAFEDLDPLLVAWETGRVEPGPGGSLSAHYTYRIGLFPGRLTLRFSPEGDLRGIDASGRASTSIRCEP